MLGYDFINQVADSINTNPIFTTVITGAKAMALSLLLLKILNTYITTLEEHDGVPKIGRILQLVGFGFFIVGSDWIINIIEQVFSGFSFALPDSVKGEFPKGAEEYLKKVQTPPENSDILPDIKFYLALIPNSLLGIIIVILEILLYILDVGVTAIYFLQRLFLLQLFKFLFPFAIALSTTKGFEDMLPRWVKIYIGLFVLGIAYLAIYNFSGIVYKFLQSAIEDSFSIGGDKPNHIPSAINMIFSTCGALLICFLLKLGLMGAVTKEVRGFFN